MQMKALSSFKAKVIEPCGKLLSKFNLKSEKKSYVSMRAPTFQMPRRRIRPRIRAKVVRFRKPFSISSLSLTQCRLERKIKSRKRNAVVSSKVKKTFRFRRSRHTKQAKKPVPKVRIAELLTVLFSLRKAKEVEMDGSDRVTTDVTSVTTSERGNGKEPFPSPITTGYVRISGASKRDSSNDPEDLEDTCKSFENYLVEMIVEESKVKDLMDVEELLYCWKNLKNPIFIELVCRFYGELCRDLFAPSEEGERKETSIT